ncbi:unnamed protein product, partial [Mesorhabditis belari]|uniref:UDENN domain-containing protein n=1 Tax=Mesorhabditis belari TaxID=2138241 RepID=A0AAF3FLC4_9BILA
MTTNSRLRQNAATIFDVFCEVANVDSEPVMLQKYPEDFCDEPTLKSILQFAFPFRTNEDSGEAVQLFSFVLTDAQSLYTFGFCRSMPKTNSCIVILSGFPWDGFFYKLLNHISVVMLSGKQSDLEGILTKAYHTDIPTAGEQLRVSTFENTYLLELTVPDISSLPTLRDDKYMLEFYNAITPAQMIALYSSLLKERRIIFTGRKLSQLSSCVQAASTILYPMFWQYLYIPVLPETLVDMLQAPMPFLIGVPKQVVDTDKVRDLGDVMVIDLEHRTLKGTHDDTIHLPANVLQQLKNDLKSGPGMGDGLSRAFLKANVNLFGGYRLGFTRKEETGVITWDKAKFVAEQRPSLQNFLSSLVAEDGVQYLERFIEERIKALNLGVPINDAFEKAANSLEIKLRAQTKDSAADVLGAIKDKMSAIQIKDKIGKLNPRELGKSATRKVQLRKSGHEKLNGKMPLSFDNIQWTEEQVSNDSSRSVSPAEKADETGNIDLIDWTSDVMDPLEEFDPSTSYAGHTPPPIPSSSNPLDTPIAAPRRSIPTSVQPLAPAKPPSQDNYRPPIPFKGPVGQAATMTMNYNPFKTQVTDSFPKKFPPSKPIAKTNPGSHSSWEKFD